MVLSFIICISVTCSETVKQFDSNKWTTSPNPNHSCKLPLKKSYLFSALQNLIHQLLRLQIFLSLVFFFFFISGQQSEHIENKIKACAYVCLWAREREGERWGQWLCISGICAFYRLHYLWPWPACEVAFKSISQSCVCLHNWASGQPASRRDRHAVIEDSW